MNKKAVIMYLNKEDHEHIKFTKTMNANFVAKKISFHNQFFYHKK